MSYTYIFANEQEFKVREGAKLHDVRERDEDEGGYLPGRIDIPLPFGQGLMNLKGGTGGWTREGREVKAGEQR